MTSVRKGWQRSSIQHLRRVDVIIKVLFIERFVDRKFMEFLGCNLRGPFVVFNVVPRLSTSCFLLTTLAVEVPIKL